MADSRLIKFARNSQYQPTDNFVRLDFDFFLCGIFALRLTRSAVGGAAAYILTFLILFRMTYESGHPQEFCGLLLSLVNSPEQAENLPFSSDKTAFAGQTFRLQYSPDEQINPSVPNNLLLRLLDSDGKLIVSLPFITE